jgi:myo-inositol-1(or 4)-monophosphatase
LPNNNEYAYYASIATRALMFSLSSTKELLSLAETAAKASGFMLEKNSNSSTGRYQGRDVKLVQDQDSEKIIVERLQAGSNFPVLSEESGWIGDDPSTDGQPYWVVDPLDGSFNYHRGIPLCCVSVALCVGTEPLIGTVFDFNRDELFSAGRGIGFLLNGEPTKIRSRPNEILCSGFPVSGNQGETVATILAKQLARWKKIRMLGSAALSLAWTAAGRADGYSEAGIMWWDVAAGLALVRESGGDICIKGAALNLPFNISVQTPNSSR